MGIICPEFHSSSGREKERAEGRGGRGESKNSFDSAFGLAQDDKVIFWFSVLDLVVKMWWLKKAGN